MTTIRTTPRASVGDIALVTGSIFAQPVVTVIKAIETNADGIVTAYDLEEIRDGATPVRVDARRVVAVLANILTKEQP